MSLQRGTEIKSVIWLS